MSSWNGLFETKFLNMEQRTEYISRKPCHAVLYKGSEDIFPAFPKKVWKSGN